MTFVDTNIFLRYLVRPVTEVDRTRAEACRELFERVSIGAETITTSEAVLAEIAYVLASPRQYGLVPADVVARLKPLVALPGLKIARKNLYLRALDIYASQPRLDFEDAITAAFVERMQPAELYSYDTDFDRIPGVIRTEPPASSTTPTR